MSAFVFVAGAYTGGWIWEDVAAALREAGAEAYPAPLTGMGGGSQPASAATDLETHIQDVVRLIDDAADPDIVLVGHCYGIHPALGAADRRPERIARVVHLDTGIPQDGDPPLNLVPDQRIRDRIRGEISDRIREQGSRRAESGDGAWLLPPPPPGAWPRWGSTEGVPAAALDRLTALAVPQPVHTFTQPLRLTGAGSALPVTGILCTANGSSIAMVETVAGLGGPAAAALTDPRVSFLELPTGHWPMLSAPAELADALLRSAAGEGRHVTARADEPPAHRRPFVLDVPERRRERIGRVDLYLPDGLSGDPSDDRPGDPSGDLADGLPDGLSDGLADAEGRRPAVVFVHGGPVPPDVLPTPRDWPAFTGYGRYVASRGAVGVTLDHRLHALTDYARAAEDVAEAVALVRADPRVDGERVALWYFSAGGLLLADQLAAPAPWLRCVAASYPVLAPPPGWGLSDSPFRPAAAVRTAGRLPIVLTRVGLETAEIAVTVAEFLAAAEECGAAVEVIDVPLGHHGFETVDPTGETRAAVVRAVDSVLAHLRG